MSGAVFKLNLHSGHAPLLFFRSTLVGCFGSLLDRERKCETKTKPRPSFAGPSQAGLADGSTFSSGGKGEGAGGVIGVADLLEWWPVPCREKENATLTDEQLVLILFRGLFFLSSFALFFLFGFFFSFFRDAKKVSRKCFLFGFFLGGEGKYCSMVFVVFCLWVGFLGTFLFLLHFTRFILPFY